jgi:hypothetical protein
VEDAEAERPERVVSSVDVGAAAVELVEVEQEVDLDVSLLAGELAKAGGEGV